ncbi:MAG: hypothetical protein M4579_004895 [Chaenotheca gracillima]|nr:MAG: hypothetical protein M4579_004895 [Chaenotheca gracillima]
MASPSETSDWLLKLNLLHPGVKHHDRRRGSLEDFFDSSGQAFAELEPTQRESSKAVFDQVLRAFQNSGNDTAEDTFMPLQMVQASYDFAIGLRGMDSMLVKFFHYLTSDKAPLPPTSHREAVEYVGSMIRPHPATRQRDSILRRVRSWSFYVLHMYLRPFKAKGGKTPFFKTPKGFNQVIFRLTRILASKIFGRFAYVETTIDAW